MSPAALTEPYQLGAGVILVPTDDGSARLLNMDGAFYALSDIGADMLRSVLNQGIPDTVRDFAESYGVTPERVRADLQALLGKLRKARLVRTGVGPSRAQRLRLAIAKLASTPLLRLLTASSRPDNKRIVTLLVFARLCFALLGWAQTVLLWSRVPPRQRNNFRATPLVEDVDQVIRRCAAHLPSVACKERALCAWYLLGCHGLPATLVVGIRLFPLEGHCWCSVGSQTLTDFADRCDTYIRVVQYGPGLRGEPIASTAGAKDLICVGA